jgi:hypothetical protein
MARVVVGPASRRDVENQLYDFGCDLVEAAAGISRCAADPDAARAVPALLGCIEAALDELGAASAALTRSNAESSPHARHPRTKAAVDRLDRGYANLHVALQDARAASHAARSLAARHAEATSGRVSRAD